MLQRKNKYSHPTHSHYLTTATFDIFFDQGHSTLHRRIMIQQADHKPITRLRKIQTIKLHTLKKPGGLTKTLGGSQKVVTDLHIHEGHGETHAGGGTKLGKNTPSVLKSQ